MHVLVPVFVGQQKRHLCLHSRFTYDFSGLEYEVTLLQNSDQSTKELPYIISLTNLIFRYFFLS